MTRNIFHGHRVRQLHKEANRKAARRSVMATAAELLAELPAAERKRLAKRHKGIFVPRSSAGGRGI